MRLFIAVQPPPEVLDLLADLPRRELTGVRWTTRDQWHITLRFLGEVDDEAPVIEALDRAPIGGCEAILGPGVQGLSRRVVCAPVTGLEDLARKVVRATATFGRPPDRRAYHGHVTLARVTRGGLAALVGAPIEARWPVRDVRLVRSRLHPHGARYEDIHVRRLDG